MSKSVLRIAIHVSMYHYSYTGGIAQVVAFSVSQMCHKSYNGGIAQVIAFSQQQKTQLKNLTQHVWANLRPRLSFGF